MYACTYDVTCVLGLKITDANLVLVDFRQIGEPKNMTGRSQGPPGAAGRAVASTRPGTALGAQKNTRNESGLYPANNQAMNTRANQVELGPVRDFKRQNAKVELFETLRDYFCTSV